NSPGSQSNKTETRYGHYVNFNFFFFQAEDGIRDGHVTGVQTCALPIFNNGGNIADTLIDWLDRKPHGYVRPRDAEKYPAPHRARSEERRVGKELRLEGVWDE